MKINTMKKNIIITGAGKGIGKQILFDCIENDIFVYGVIRSEKDFIEIKKKFKGSKNCKLYHGDIKNISIAGRIIKDSKKMKKKISGLVNNAGERQRENFLNINNSKLTKIFKNNFFNHFFFTQKIIKNHKKIKNKFTLSIVNIGSIVGLKGFSQLSGYASTKSALDGLTKSLAIEFANDNIRLNIIHPGFIKTSYYKNFKKNNKKLYRWTLQKTPLRRWGESKDISQMVIFLLSEKSDYITGQSIAVDGGWTAF